MPVTNSLVVKTIYVYTDNYTIEETIVGGVSQPYTWDANGNLLPDGVYDYEYDSANRLAGLSEVSGTDVYTYTYNGMGYRLSQEMTGTLTADIQYLLDLNTPLPQVLGDEDNLYVYGLGRIGEQAAAGGAWEYHHGDALGSRRLLTDGTGQVTRGTNYEPFGAVLDVLPASPGGESVFGFTGEQTDPTGMVYLRARYYEPLNGMFLQKDPFVGNRFIPYSIHSYQYAYANPVMYIDPSGRVSVLCSIMLQPGESCEKKTADLRTQTDQFFIDQIVQVATTSRVPGLEEIGIGDTNRRFYDLNSYPQESLLLYIDLILEESKREMLTSAQTAYVLATAHFESNFGAQLVESQLAAERNNYERLTTNEQPGDGIRYRGRGFVQLTGRQNYRKMTTVLRTLGATYNNALINIEEQPDLAADPEVAAAVLVQALAKGTLISHVDVVYNPQRSLSAFINGESRDYIGARDILGNSYGAEYAAILAEAYYRVMNWNEIVQAKLDYLYSRCLIKQLFS